MEKFPQISMAEAIQKIDTWLMRDGIKLQELIEHGGLIRNIFMEIVQNYEGILQEFKKKADEREAHIKNLEDLLAKSNVSLPANTVSESAAVGVSDPPK